ncbi:MAG: VOC family protein [Candidatus Lustribacter sp.]|jgi:extradiol dioxygenase family protein
MADVESLNHTAMCVHDLPEALNFYCHVLGAKRASRTNFQLEHVLGGVAVFQSIILGDYMFALCVAPNDMPMPPAEQLRGALGFRHGFVVTRDRFDEVQESLRRNDVRFEGPVDHPHAGPFGQSVYLKDPSGNFLEILWRRDEEALDLAKRRYVTTE